MKPVLPLFFASALLLIQSSRFALAQSDTAQLEIRGMALPALQVALNAPVDGIVDQILVTDGQVVQAGQLLAVMDAGVQKAVVAAARLRAEAKADLLGAELEFKDAQLALERIEQAANEQAAKDWEVRRAQLRRDSAQARIAAARETLAIAAAELDLEQQRLDRFSLKAPWTGYVQRVTADPGATLSRADPILRLVALDSLEAEIYLPANLHQLVSVGQQYTIHAGEPVSRSLKATLTFADKVIDPASNTFRCILRIDNSDMKLPAGFALMLPWPQP